MPLNEALGWCEASFQTNREPSVESRLWPELEWVWPVLNSAPARQGKTSCFGVSAFPSESRGKLFSQPSQAKGFRITAALSHVGRGARGQVAFPKAKGIFFHKSHKDSSGCALPVEHHCPFVVVCYSLCSFSAWELPSALRFLSTQCQYLPRTSRSIENIAGKVEPTVRR